MCNIGANKVAEDVKPGGYPNPDRTNTNVASFAALREILTFYEFIKFSVSKIESVWRDSNGNYIIVIPLGEAGTELNRCKYLDG